jgi:hydroxymethylbilane synthase
VAEALEKLRIGTRGSMLALAQAELVAKALAAAKAVGDIEVVPIKTSGDSGPGPGGDKARFVREIERALLDGEVDLGVHSAKDLPTDLPDGLMIAGVPKRDDARDAFLGHVDSLGAVAEGARIGTSSLRRRSQILARRPDVRVEELRGNVDTRIERLEAGDFDGIALAVAGLRRLNRAEEISFIAEPHEVTPAPGQGALALEVREDATAAVTMAETITDRESLATLRAERAVVRSLGADCHTPLGVHATIADGRMHLRGFCGLPDGSEWIRDEVEEDASFPTENGEQLAERMRAAGAGDILERASQMAGGPA